MKQLAILWGAAFLALFGMVTINSARAGVDQKLLTVQNDATIGGHYSVAIQVKGNGLTAANTLGSATIDIQFDRTKLTFVNATNWAFGSAEGYNRSANNDSTFIRLAITGGGVNENNDGTPPGIDIGTEYATWVQLNFTIAAAAGYRPMTIAPGSNAISLYANHGNNPNTGVLISQQLSSPENTTDVRTASKDVPLTFALDQNYPNPFNPSTSIEFALPRQEHVVLEVFNVLGQRVATLVNETRPAGYYTEKFNGAGLASGIYFYRMSTGGLIFLKKMLMIK
jgi:hypothetical protein